MRNFFTLLILLDLTLLLSCSQPDPIEYTPDVGKIYSLSLSKSSEVWTYDFTGLGLDDSMANPEADGRITQLKVYYYNADVNLGELAIDHESSLEKASYHLYISTGNIPYFNGDWSIASSLDVSGDLSSIITPSEVTSSFFVGDVFGMQDFPEFDSASQVRVSVSNQNGTVYIFEGDPNGKVVCVNVTDSTPDP